ncbi:TlpA family protein disulfide reductase, partial [Verrucomicrobia bacterium]|nr:TlpA family protein disulfide reductase [Verrucomicrobiota bacterium]
MNCLNASLRWLAKPLVCLFFSMNLNASAFSGFQREYRTADSEETFSSESFQGRILVLDFFAHWCAPCLRVSPLIEKDIAEYYLEQNGNKHGIPVDVVAVNVEASSPKRTDLFIRRTGLKKVIDDFNGTLLSEFKAESIPLLVVLDGTHSGGDLKVVYQKAGFEGVSQLRAVIDSITGSSETVTNIPVRSEGQSESGIKTSARSVERKSEASGEALISDDYQLTQWDLSYGHTYGKTKWDFGLG